MNVRERRETRGRRGQRACLRADTHRRAFTLTELLIVIGLLVVLMGLAVGVTGALRLKSHRDSAVVLVGRVETALEEYRTVFGHWPSNIGTTPAATDYAVPGIRLQGSSS